MNVSGLSIMCGRSHNGLYNLCKLDVSWLSAITLIPVELLGQRCSSINNSGVAMVRHGFKMEKDRVIN